MTAVIASGPSLEVRVVELAFNSTAGRWRAVPSSMLWRTCHGATPVEALGQLADHISQDQARAYRSGSGQPPQLRLVPPAEPIRCTVEYSTAKEVAEIEGGETPGAFRASLILPRGKAAAVAWGATVDDAVGALREELQHGYVPYIEIIGSPEPRCLRRVVKSSMPATARDPQPRFRNRHTGFTVSYLRR